MASYEVKSTKNGFVVIPKKYEYINPVEVTMDEFGFWHAEQKSENHFCDTNFSLPAYSFFELSDRIVDTIYDDWKSPKVLDKTKQYTPNKIYLWAKKETGKSLNARLHNEWKRGIDTFIDARTNELHKKLFSVACGRGDILRLKDVLAKDDPYVIRDLLNHRASRIALLYGGWDGTDNWVDSFSPCGSYRTLNRTIFNLPYGFPAYDLPSLKNEKMSYPINTRIKLMFYLKIVGRHYFVQQDNLDDMIRILERSTEEDCKNAIRFMWNYYPSPKANNFRSSKEIGRIINLIIDRQPSSDRISLLNWARESELWHHNIAYQNAIHHFATKEEQKQYEQSETALPPIPLPENPNIKFLNTYKDVVEEGRIMQHCIATYAKKAVTGGSYLFHVDHNGDCASVEVSPKGYVLQSYGMRDVINEASLYGKNELTKWAKGLGNKKPVLRHNLILDFAKAVTAEDIF